MSSSPPAETHANGEAPSAGRSSWWRRWRAGWSLRAQLLAAMIGLLAVMCASIGVATTHFLGRDLVQQLDDRLRPAFDRGGPRYGGGGPAPRGLPQGLDGQLDAHILPNGSFEIASVRYVAQSELTLTADQQAILRRLPRDGQPHTRDLGSIDDYRLIATSDDTGEIRITGLPMEDVYRTQSQLAIVVTLVSLAALALTALLGALIITRTVRPLGRVAATARRVARLPLDRGEVALSVRVPDEYTDPRTEVGQVGAALNRMLGHVGAALTARQESETRVRHFVADASHELRTPLAAIRGYAELTRRYGDAVPPDIAHAMRRVESESARMTTLVDDLLLLARLDSGRPLLDEPVDLSRLVIDAVSDARVASPDHHWQLDLPEEAVLVRADGARLHQVVANLLANCRTHTPPGTTVRTAVSVTGPDATVVVTDDGPGIPEDLLPDVFDRFARGDTSRSRAAGSTGLGLAIVAAVVAAHGGQVGVESRPGRTVFTVRLPLVSAGDRDPVPV